MPASGAIGAACEVPETAAKTKVATAIAKTVRIILVLLEARTLCEHITRQHDGSSTAMEILAI